jgi:hypothetical protein
VSVTVSRVRLNGAGVAVVSAARAEREPVPVRYARPMLIRSLAVLALIATPALAEPAKPPKLEGAFAFDVMKPRAKCAKVTGALLTRLTKSYSCGPAESDTASGVKTVAVCKAKTGDSQFLLFAANADCENERETQLANGA